MTIQKNGIIKTKEFLENTLSGSTYTINGTLTNNGSIFSGFSAANYITTNGSISANTSGFIVFGHYKTGSDITTEQYVGCTLSRNLSTSIINSKFRLLVCSNNGGGWGTIINSTNNVTVNTDYFYKIVTDGTKLYLYINGELWITLTLPASGTYTDTTWGFGNHLPTKVCPSLGSVNLKDCGIIINGVTTWSGDDAYMVNTNAKINKNYVTSNGFYEV